MLEERLGSIGSFDTPAEGYWFDRAANVLSACAPLISHQFAGFSRTAEVGSIHTRHAARGQVRLIQS
jgi:hypothetical protein